MDLSTILQLDPAIALSIVNERLRLECSDLEDLTSMCGVETEALQDKLSSIGWHYDPVSNQFKSD